MTVNELKQQIQAQQLQKWYVFIGDEIGVMKIYQRKLADMLGAEITYVDSVKELAYRQKVRSLVDNPHLYIIIDDMDFISDADFHDSFKGLKNDTVIFYYSTTDKRNKFWKLYDEYIVEFPRLEPRMLKKYIQKSLPKFSDKACDKLISVCQQDYSLMMLEIDKIRSFQKTQNSISAVDAFRELLHDNTIITPADDNFFKFINALMARDCQLAIAKLDDIKRVGEKSSVSLIAALYLNIRAILQIQTCTSDDIEKSTGLTSMQINMARPYLNKYSDEELEEILLLLHRVDSDIKKGIIPDAIAIDYIMVNML